MTRRARVWLVRGAVVALIAVLLVLGWARRDSAAPADVGQPAPDFLLPLLAGDSLTLSGLRGRVVLLNFWATWCAPCRHEMPAMQRAYEALRPDGLEIVAVSVDAAPGERDALGNAGGDVAGFAQELGLTFPIALDPAQDVKRRYGVWGLPTTLLVDRQGRVRERILGGRYWDTGASAGRLRALLAESR